MRIILLLGILAIILTSIYGFSSPAKELLPPEGYVFEGPQDVSLTTRDNYTIAATYFPSFSRRELIILHSTGRGRDDNSPLAEFMQKKGFNVVTIALRGYGGSSNPAPDRDWGCCNRNDYYNMTYDVEAAKRFLGKQIPSIPFIKPAKISLVGSSLGTGVAMNYTQMDPSIEKVVLVSPLKEIRTIPVYEIVQEYKKPLMIVVGEKDGGTDDSPSPAADSKEIYNLSISKNKKYVGVEDSDLHAEELLNANRFIFDEIYDFLR